jgi:hypothetical protein
MKEKILSMRRTETRKREEKRNASTERKMLCPSDVQGSFKFNWSFFLRRFSCLLSRGKRFQFNSTAKKNLDLVPIWKKAENGFEKMQC